jgi:anti-sigma B factor antagonist
MTSISGIVCCRSIPPGVLSRSPSLGSSFVAAEWQVRVRDFQLLLSEPSDGVLELRLMGEVDMSNVQTLRDATATASASYQCLVFDLSELRFIDSSGLHALAEANRAMVERDGSTKVICAPGNIRRVFELTGLDRVFSIVPTREQALAVAV